MADLLIEKFPVTRTTRIPWSMTPKFGSHSKLETQIILLCDPTAF
jgi:hypothetical protein